MATSRLAVPQPLDAEALAQSRAPSASPSPLPQLGYRVAQPPIMLSAPCPPSLAGQAPQLRMTSQAPTLSIPVSSPPSQVFQLSPSVSLTPLKQGLRPSIPVSPRRSVKFDEWKTVADITPNASTYGEHPAIFNFDKNGSHIHYFDQFGALTKAPWKDMSLLSPVDDQSSPTRTFASSPMAAASPAPAGSTPYAMAPKRLLPAAGGPLFFASTAAPQPLFFPSATMPASPNPGLVFGSAPPPCSPRVLSMTGGSPPQSSMSMAPIQPSSIQTLAVNSTLASQLPTLGRSCSAGYLVAPTISSTALTSQPFLFSADLAA